MVAEMLFRCGHARPDAERQELRALCDFMAKLRDVLDKPETDETDVAGAAREAQTRAAQDVGPGSAAEAEREHDRLEELESEVHRLRTVNGALESDAGDLRKELETLKQQFAPRPAEVDGYCSFCNKSQHEVTVLVAGPTVFICDECVDECVSIVHEHREPPKAKLEEKSSCPAAQPERP